MKLEKYLTVSEEVKNAIKENKPVVALESTIISHGMPYPKNVETALEVEKVVRENGAIPATIAIINGEIKVRPIMSLGLTIDHRVVDGLAGAKFMKDLKELLENPITMLI